MERSKKGSLRPVIIEAVKSRTGTFTVKDIYEDVKEIAPSTTLGSVRTYLNSKSRGFIGIVELLVQGGRNGRRLYKYKEAVEQEETVGSTIIEETIPKTDNVSAVEIGEGMIALLKSKDKEITKLKDIITLMENERKMSSNVSHGKVKELQTTISRLNDKIIEQNRKIHKYENPSRTGFSMSELAKFLPLNRNNNND